MLDTVPVPVRNRQRKPVVERDAMDRAVNVQLVAGGPGDEVKFGLEVFLTAITSDGNANSEHLLQVVLLQGKALKLASADDVKLGDHGAYSVPGAGKLGQIFEIETLSNLEEHFIGKPIDGTARNNSRLGYNTRRLLGGRRRDRKLMELGVGDKIRQ